MGLCPTLWVGEFTRFKDKERETYPFLGFGFNLFPDAVLPMIAITRFSNGEQYCQNSVYIKVQLLDL